VKAVAVVDCRLANVGWTGRNKVLRGKEELDLLEIGMGL